MEYKEMLFHKKYFIQQLYAEENMVQCEKRLEAFDRDRSEADTVNHV